MPQETNLNVSPYFDDFDDTKNYYKVLFKPGYPIQARELTNLQSILQNQIENFGNHIFKDGSVVIPGQINYNNSFNAVQVENTFSGIPLSSFLNSLKGKVIRGTNSGVRAKVLETLDSENSPSNNITIFVNYLNTNIETNQKVFLDSESLIVEETIFSNNSNSSISAETEFANTISSNASSIGSAIILSSGVYYIRGYFVNVSDQTLILDAHSNIPSYKVGFNVIEDIVNSDEDNTLTDNAQGFNNYAAPGADRFKISVELTKKPLDESNTENFIELLKVENGVLIKNVKNPQYNVIRDELARRTYDESGDYYVSPFKISAQETLNDLKGNNGVFSSEQQTYNNNTPSENIGCYKVSPGKAYIRGYEVETISPTYLDFSKTRESKLITNETLNYFTGPTYSLNRVYGSPIIGIGTDYTVSLRDSRVGASQISSAGKEIGLARVYDFALESGGYDLLNQNTNIWDISLFDIQTYTEISFSVPTTLSIPTHIKGKSSGGTAYLRYPVTNSGIATFYNVKGKFSAGEKFIFNGTEDLSRVATSVTSYGTGDVQSLYGIVGSAYTFTSDVVQSVNTTVGIVSITSQVSGISTVNSTNFRFTGIATVGNLVSYSTPGLIVPSFAKISAVSERSIVISPITSVTGVCDGSLPSTAISPSDFSILSSKFLPSSDNNLYTILPKRNISSVDLTNSRLTIRRQYEVTISNNETSPISCGSNEKFLSFDEERYILIREDGVTEPLSEDKIKISRTSNPEVLTVVGLTTSISTRAKLIVTVEKSKVSSKTKNKNRVNSIIVNKSKLLQSGIGTTTSNDGLSYGLFPYGTRVQDEEICLLTPDVTKIYAVYESNDVANPDLPSIILESIQSQNNSTNDLILGEEFIGSESKSVGIFVESKTSAELFFIYLNDNRFIIGETVEFKESGVKALISSISGGDNNITQNYTFDNGQKNTIYDYSRIVRKSGVNPPTRKIKIVYESASFSASDNGNIITKNSYDSFDYKEIPSINGVRNSDIIDIRPSVSNFTVSSGVRSPFEFLGRSFISPGNSSPDILASDESIAIDYSFYLPRIDRIYVSKDGVFQISKGKASENPELPKAIDDSIEIATAYLPSYIFNIKDIKFNILQYRRYRMKDIHSLENRIENLEYYTTLSLLETKTANLTIKDSQGLDRFKSGFFVDNFESTQKQKRITGVKNSIDVENSELRPTHYTTSVDLGFGEFESDPQSDLNYRTSIQGSNITKSEKIITLSFSEKSLLSQPFATRVENVTPYLVTYYSGTIELNPASDTWVDTVRLNANTIVAENYIETTTQLTRQEFDSQSGFGQVIWGSWNTMWTGNQVRVSEGSTVVRNSNIIQQTNITTTQTGFSTRTGTSTRLIREPLGNTSLGDKKINTSVVPFMRSRNIEFIGKRFKPFTRLYSFFDGVDVNQYCFPKLVEIQMTTGTFEVGETVIGRLDSSNPNSPFITFRVAQSNHREGPYNDPSDVYAKSPYNSNLEIPSTYSSTSTVLNIDLFTLSSQSSSSFYGSLSSGMTLRGQTSGAVAIVSSTRIITDSVGSVRGSFFIPNPNVDVHPKFESGTKIFRLTDNSTNTFIPGLVNTGADEKYFSEGRTETVQENILSIRTVRKETAILSESRTETGTPNTVVVESVVGTVPPPPPPPQPPLPPAPPVITTPPVIPTETVAPITPTTTTPGTASCLLEVVSASILGTLSNTTTSRSSILTGSTTISVVRGQTLPAPVIQISYQQRGFSSVNIFAVSKTDSNIVYQLNSTSSSFTANDFSQRNNLISSIRSVSYTIPTTFRSGNYNIVIRGSSLLPTIQNTTIVCNRTVNEFIIGSITVNDAPVPPPPTPIRVDPLAQSFFIDQVPGVFVTSLDLYFATKDSELPVTVQLRSMSLGLPTETIYPFGEVVLNANRVNVSEDASIPTRVEFPSPVFLSGNQEHSIILLSNSTEYRVWISRLGEEDISTTSLPESQRTIVSKQSLLGSLFKSQNGSTWTPSQYEDLKFNLYNAYFISEGTVNFYNPVLSKGNNQIARLINNPLEVNSRKIRVGLGTTVTDPYLTIGNTIIQQNSNASGVYVGAAGSATGTLLVSNPGIGYTPTSSSYIYTGVALTSITGSGRDATASVFINNGVAIAATITSGGVGYQVGDIVTVVGLTTASIGRNIQLTVQSTSGNNELILDNVQGDFVVGAGYTVQYINNSGVTTYLNGNGANVLLLDPPKIITDGLHIKVNHKNHGMHSDLNKVIISDVSPDTKSSTTTELTNGTNDIIISDTEIGNFAIFENISVSPTNPGYAIIENEVISYTGVTTGAPGTLTGITRSINQPRSFEVPAGTSIRKYEFNGISLRRINKVHDLVDVDDSIISDPIGLDHYHIKIDTSTNGVDRSVGVTNPKLYFNETKNGGANNCHATQNIQFEALTPQVQNMTVAGTDISATIRTVTATSINGSEEPFIDKGFEDIDLNSTNYFNSPRMICSKVNEDNRLSTLPNKKSLTLSLNLSTSNPNVSPVIDTDKIAMITTTNRINSPIQNYISDGRVATLEDDPTSFVYATEVISLENPATSIKIIVAAHDNVYSDIRAFYSLVDGSSGEIIYYPFPGYTNRLISGEVIDLNMSDGTSDKFVAKTDKLGFASNDIEFKDYEFTVDNLPSFRYFTIKLIGTSTNQAYPPRFRDLRVIGLA